MVVHQVLAIDRKAQVLVDQVLHARNPSIEIERILGSLGIRQELLEHTEDRKRRSWDVVVTEKIPAYLVGLAVIQNAFRHRVELSKAGRLGRRRELIDRSAA